jgi:hypothetical protein
VKNVSAAAACRNVTYIVIITARVVVIEMIYQRLMLQAITETNVCEMVQN